MKSDDIIKALDVGQKWTRQIKSEEKRPSSSVYRNSMWTVSRRSLKDICYEHMEAAWEQASGNLPTAWRQVFYVMRNICDNHPDADRPLVAATFKGILERYIEKYDPGWDVLYGARGFFKEPHSAEDDNGLAMSTMNVRNYLGRDDPDSRIKPISFRFPTSGSTNRISAVLICEKEGFDELLLARQVPERYDLALMSTKGISAHAARDLAAEIDVPCFTLHDLDKNGFVMASGFPFAHRIGLHMEDVEKWSLRPEDQSHTKPHQTYENLRKNGATKEEANFISAGQRVELNMLSGPEFIEFVQSKLEENGVEKIIPDDATLEAAWKRAHLARKVNSLISSIYDGENYEPGGADVPPMPVDIAARIRDEFDDEPALSWDDVLWSIAHEEIA